MNRSRFAPALAAGLALLAGAAAASGAAEPMSRAELAAVRGGYVTAQGITFGFGVTQTLSVNGQPALASTLTLTDQGVVASGQGSLIIPAGLKQTLLATSINPNQIVALVVNTADNRVINENTQVTLTLPGFPALAQSIAQEQAAAGLVSAVQAASLGAIRH